MALDKMFYLCITVITELLMISMTLHVATYSGFTKTQKFWYLMTFAAVMLCSLAEYAVHCGFYSVDFKIPLTILTVIQFSIAPFLGILFSGALGMHKEARVAALVFSANILVEVIAAPFGWIFFFDGDGYHRGNLFWIYIAFYFLSLVYLIVCMFLVGRKFKHRDTLTIGMVLVVLIAGIIPMTILKVNVTYMAIAIGASLCYIYYNDLVQQDIQAEVKENQRKMQEMQTHIISGLANLIENRDIETGEHITRTSNYAKLLAELAAKEGVYTEQLTDHFIALIYALAPLHDIGKIVVSDRILRKPGRLTDEEFEIMKRHASVGGTLVREVLNGITDEEYILFASDVATFHHEKWNGAGYPMGLKEEKIPLSARIMAVADVYDALVSERCYKKPMPPEEAIEIIKEESGTHFDPHLVEVFLKHKDEFMKVSQESDESGSNN